MVLGRLLGSLLGSLHPTVVSMRQKVNCAMFVQTIDGCQLSHLYLKPRVDSAQTMIQITVTNKTTAGVIILR